MGRAWPSRYPEPGWRNLFIPYPQVMTLYLMIFTMLQLFFPWVLFPSPLMWHIARWKASLGTRMLMGIDGGLNSLVSSMVIIKHGKQS